jgi:hypothetical protein
MWTMQEIHVSPQNLTLIAIISAIFGGLNLLLNTFLANRRVRKDRLDDQRWSICPLVNDGPKMVHHRHAQKSGPPEQRP